MTRRILVCLLLLCAPAWVSASASADGLTYLAHAPTKPTAHPPLIVLLHGSGADERDMIGLWAQLPPSFAVVSPRAPFRDAGGGFRWYRRGATRDADIDLSRKIIDLVVANAVERFHADPGRIFVAGFSQGAVMVYDLVLHESGRFRGGAVLSGSLFPSELTGVPTHMDWQRDAVFIAHGTADPRIPFGAAVSARATLERLGVPVTFHTYPGMHHETSNAEIGDLGVWLSERLAP